MRDLTETIEGIVRDAHDLARLAERAPTPRREKLAHAAEVLLEQAAELVDELDVFELVVSDIERVLLTLGSRVERLRGQQLQVIQGGAA